MDTSRPDESEIKTQINDLLFRILPESATIGRMEEIALQVFEAVMGEYAPDERNRTASIGLTSTEEADLDGWSKKGPKWARTGRHG